MLSPVCQTCRGNHFQGLVFRGECSIQVETFYCSVVGAVCQNFHCIHLQVVACDELYSSKVTIGLLWVLRVEAVLSVLQPVQLTVVVLK